MARRGQLKVQLAEDSSDEEDNNNTQSQQAVLVQKFSSLSLAIGGRANLYLAFLCCCSILSIISPNLEISTCFSCTYSDINSKFSIENSFSK